jgi:hypothetical protein
MWLWYIMNEIDSGQIKHVDTSENTRKRENGRQDTPSSVRGCRDVMLFASVNVFAPNRGRNLGFHHLLLGVTCQVFI